MTNGGGGIISRLQSLSILFLLIEFFDELIYGIQSAALPVIRSALALSYAQVGLLLGVPKAISTIIEPVIMLFGDTGLRKRLVIAGGFALSLAMLLVGAANQFFALLIAFIISFPASGAFVSLSQATLMDLNPGREPHSMARWTAAGSLGNVLGPLLLAGLFTLGLSWRPVYLGLAIFGLALAMLLMPKRFPESSQHPAIPPAAGPGTPGKAGAPGIEAAPLHFGERIAWIFHNIRQALGNRLLLRFVILLEFSDLLLDVFMGYAALYFADVAGLAPAQVGLVIGGLTAASLVANLVLIPLLEKFPGRQVVRASATAALFVYLAWLLAPWLWAKVALTMLVPFATLGWYPVLKGETYASVPGRTATVEAINSVAGVLGGVLAFVIGWVAERFGLPLAMWLLLAAPLCLVLFVPRTQAH